MRKYLYLSLLVVLLAAAFLSGYWYSRQTVSLSGSAGGRQILYYVDPMNPGHRYDKAGIAPCGMQLEPVYAGAENEASGKAALPPGAVHVSTEKQQLIGVRTEMVEKASGAYTVRALGRVAADETRIYRINASAEGWIKKVFPLSTGSLVKKDEPLAHFYTSEALTAQQTYIYTMSKDTPSQINLQQYRDRLRSLGMTDIQIDEIGRTRELTKDIVIASPVTGFVIARNVSPGQTFNRGTELYSIADLSRVWILLDTYENEAQYFKPGESIPVHYQGKLFHARVSTVLPQFDPATRTLKVRLELNNPGYILRPDMFVNVEHTVHMPPAVTVPVDAVLDSGLRKIVFVDRGNGIFEPRKVETGEYFDERVEIVRGLIPGERIVVSGNFLLDSESKMKSPSSGPSGTADTDLVCGMAVDQGKSKAAGLTSDYKGRTYFFCAKACKLAFDNMPQRYAEKPGGDKNSPKPTGGRHNHDSMSKMKLAPSGPSGTTSVDPVCGMEVSQSRSKAAGLTSDYKGKTYFFCAKECKQEFENSPQRYPEKPERGRDFHKAAGNSGHTESKMSSSPAAVSGTTSVDLICGMEVDQSKAKAAGLTSDYQGKTYFFCAKECKLEFDKSPGRYTEMPEMGKDSHVTMDHNGEIHD